MHTRWTYRASRRACILWPWLLCCATFALGACSKAPGKSAEKIPRESEAPPVVYVDSPNRSKIEYSGEVEPNNDLSQGSELALGAGVRGTLDGQIDKDLYTVNIERDGALMAELSGIEKVDLMLELLDGKGEVLAISDRGPAGTIEGIANFAVTEGRYHLRVSEFVKKRKKKRKKRRKRKKKSADDQPEGRTGLSPVYQLVVASRPQNQPRHEIEDNRTPKTATEILLGDETVGFIGWARDVDVWKLSKEGFTSQYGVAIDLSGVDGVSLILQILDERGKLVLERRGRKGDSVAVRNLVLVRDAEDQLESGGERGGPAPGSGVESGSGFYYARIKARRSNPVEEYRLRMSTRLLEIDEELEPNDKVEQATPLAAMTLGASGVTRAYLTLGDADRFVVPAQVEPGVLNLKAIPNGEVDVEIAVAVDGQTLASVNARGRADQEVLNGVSLPAGKEAIIAVTGKGAGPSDARYELSWSLEPGTFGGGGGDGLDDGPEPLDGSSSGASSDTPSLLDDDYGDE